MQSLRLFGPRDLRVVEEPVPQPAPGEALLRVRSVTVCHSDVHYYRDARIGNTVSDVPLVLGHEFAAEVVEVTPEVTHVRPGDLVAVQPAVSCGHCRYCVEGNPNLCLHIQFCGTPPMDGSLRQYVAYGGRFLHPLPEGFTADDGALLEPLGVALHGWDLGKARLAETVAVIGCGPIGLLVVQLALRGGAAQVLAVEPLAYRRQIAADLGAVPLEPGEDLESHIADLTDGHGADVVLELAGTLSGQEAAARAAKRGGTVVLIGIPPEDEVLMPHHVARRKGLTIKMARRMKHTYPRAIELVRRGMVDLAPLITHRFPLERAAEAFEMVGRYEDGVIKAAVYP
ncbi:MAG TPA: alcohol dehydrogenase catalytic domain-containing protein [Chloroflexi bacterium]|jgi:L-iditol 2-dehydrogenase|nr:alcohol dehydrogenase catalytic domain-containing protein [Chloroflexota bacterium]